MNPLDDYVVFDVETVPDRYDEYRSLFPKSKKKPGIHGFISKIVAIGIIRDGSADCRVAECGSEYDLLEWFNQEIDVSPKAALVGYNIKNFDIPLIRFRSAKYGISCHLPARNSVRICDIYDLMGGKWGTDTSSGSLDELAWALFGEGKMAGSGSEVAGWFAKGEYGHIKNHCLEDLWLTERIYREFKGTMF